MTQLDVTYHLAAPPREASALALNSLREVYGIRRVDLNERDRTIHIEYDATRLTDSILRQLLRRAGLDLAEPPREIVPDELPAAEQPAA
ncbi:hypothetical protein [Terriglobus sp.]|uniref:hypothetical protein n=1 Tax=Terriglobus sp. TaxID=1889013 RepID=UPI003AFF6400